jgi:hypothetical protein
MSIEDSKENKEVYKNAIDAAKSSEAIVEDSKISDLDQE